MGEPLMVNGALVEAFVQTGAAVTSYRRAGRGAPVLLLAVPGSAVGALFEPLAARFRVLHPVPPDACDARWLGELIEALGLDRPAIVAEQRFAALLHAAAGCDAGRLGPIHLLDDARDVDDLIDAIELAARDSAT